MPLDPVQAVAEFARYVGQRRDMFFAAQAARRLRELEGFGLRVPESYRRYSTGRCATFEAPEGPTRRSWFYRRPRGRSCGSR
ncbi:hypothetical protein GBA65_05185 [Rubrobacter marinus]|uniref:Uncharacterized protein n=1 Tax=Rubrobacter marinus TaxID=2653852 RepID=A0A6G8PU90_9ACTN|nr:hypothetical protein [Rubrobacter marinus]QIN78010.1 hypothetical protein GBA65_05185 [Rubrobacter marinus]